MDFKDSQSIVAVVGDFLLNFINIYARLFKLGSQTLLVRTCKKDITIYLFV